MTMPTTCFSWFSKPWNYNDWLSNLGTTGLCWHTKRKSCKGFLVPANQPASWGLSPVPNSAETTPKSQWPRPWRVTVMRQTAKSKRDVQRDTESCCMDSHVLLRSGEIREHSVGGWAGREASGRRDWTQSTGEWHQQHRQRRENEGRGDGLIEREIFITERKATRRAELKLAGGSPTTLGFRRWGFPSRGKWVLFQCDLGKPSLTVVK